MSLTYAKGSECNPVKIGGTTQLFGDKTRKPEKPYTIVLFPGGSVEISRVDEGENAGGYWVHVAIDPEAKATCGEPVAYIAEARIDAKRRYCDEANAALGREIAQGDVNHIAFLVKA